MPQLVYTDPESGQEVTVELGDQLPEVTIGRNPGNVVRVNNPSISRQHAKVVFDNGQCTLLDLDSSNGSYINGNRIRSQVLVDGDRIRVGEFPVDYRGANDSATAEVDQSVIDSVLRSAGGGGSASNGDFRRQTALGGFEADNEVAEQSGPVGQSQGGPFNQWDQPRSTGRGNPFGVEQDDAFDFVDQISGQKEGDSGPLTLPDDAIIPVADDGDSDAELIADDFIVDESHLEGSSEGALDTKNATPDEIARELRDLDMRAKTNAGNENETVEQDLAHLMGMAGGGATVEEPGHRDPLAFDEGELDEVSLSDVESLAFEEEDDEPSDAGPSVSADGDSSADLASRIAELEKERDELLDLLDNRAGDASGASQVQIDRLRSERDRLIEERRNLKRQITDLQATVKKAPDLEAFEQTQADLEEALAQIVQLEDDLGATKEAVEQSVDSEASAKSELEAMHAELHQARQEAEEAEQLREELESLKAHLSQTEAAMGEHANQASAYESDLSAAQSEVQQLVQDLEAREERIAELEAEVADARNAMAELERELEMTTEVGDAARNEAQSLNERVAQLQAELDSRPVSEEVDQLVKDLAQTRASLDAMTAQRDELDQAKKALEEQGTQKDKDAKDLQKQFDKNKKELVEVTKERDQLKTEKGAFARETDYLQSERRKHDSELRDMKKKLQKLEKDDKRKKQVFAELSGDLKKLVKENNELQKKIDGLQNDLEKAPSDGELKELREQLRDAEKSIKALEKDTSDMTRELGALSDVRDKLQKDVEVRDATIAALEESAADAGAASEKTAELEAQLAELQSELEAAKQAAEDAASASEGGGEDLDKLRKQLADTENTLAEIILERDKLEDQLKKKKK